MSCFFFFQAEDGIRDLTVTGVQTCALPIFQIESPPGAGGVSFSIYAVPTTVVENWSGGTLPHRDWFGRLDNPDCKWRSEERRVGKECRSRWSAEHSEKKCNIEHASRNRSAR